MHLLCWANFLYVARCAIARFKLHPSEVGLGEYLIISLFLSITMYIYITYSGLFSPRLR